MLPAASSSSPYRPLLSYTLACCSHHGTTVSSLLPSFIHYQHQGSASPLRRCHRYAVGSSLPCSDTVAASVSPVHLFCGFAPSLLETVAHDSSLVPPAICAPFSRRYDLTALRPANRYLFRDFAPSTRLRRLFCARLRSKDGRLVSQCSTAVGRVAWQVGAQVRREVVGLDRGSKQGRAWRLPSPVACC